jgi:hypothetical protein
LRVLLEELELGVKDIGHHLIVDALVDLHELQGFSMRFFTILLLRYFPPKEVTTEETIMRRRITS